MAGDRTDGDPATGGSLVLFSGLSDEKVSEAKLQPCRDIAQAVRERLDRAGDRARIAVLPQGPLTIPYLGG